MHILLVEDDQQAAAYLVKGLQECGHTVDHAADGEQGLTQALNASYEVLVIDRMLPKRDGLTLVRMLRADHCSTPILVLSALGEVDDRVEGLRAGGDDYLIKPYAFAELLARLDALVRRQSGKSASLECLRLADLEFNLVNRKVTRSGRTIRLQPMELKLLEYLLRHTGRVVTRTMLLEQVWGFHFDPQTNVIDTQISRLRSKIDKNFSLPLVHTLRGIGYKLDEFP